LKDCNSCCHFQPGNSPGSLAAGEKDPADAPLTVVAFKLNHDVDDLMGEVQDVFAGGLEPDPTGGGWLLVCWRATAIMASKAMGRGCSLRK
jgi:hypothetical protein